LCFMRKSFRVTDVDFLLGINNPDSKKPKSNKEQLHISPGDFSVSKEIKKFNVTEGIWDSNGIPHGISRRYVFSNNLDRRGLV
jgi:hypothetical protein